MPAIPAIVAVVVSAFLAFVTAVLLYLTFVVPRRQERDQGERTTETTPEESGSATLS